jgi:hypothetical protein
MTPTKAMLYLLVLEALSQLQQALKLWNVPKGFAQGTPHALGGELGQTTLRVGSHRRFGPK